ncbi:MAG: GIY-YIG nuclease family protein [Flavobacterium nitrogenifigens]|uniref:GIY-YIG nuclease family protein n=1 Tax=Flavobacterium nitrogenifigens TaxID=1617283 RepID=UPI0028098809|nr:GIY-YIG nuclease family protein [Flavobacterium nitrogenifigens]MDQ8011389.1 GIY-YIG nuclease family protein [Flavobacterium nitrogenifigens]
MKKENKINIVYKVTNKETGEAYIGATTKSIEERKADHIQKANNGTGSYFHQAISTYGTEVFAWEQIDTASTTDELAQKESKYILENNTKEEGYNGDKGGGIKKTVYKYNLDGSLNATFDNLTSAGNSINVRKQDISRACLGVSHTLGGYLWSYDYKEPYIIKPDNRKKQIMQCNLKEEELARYISASEASKITGISKTCITRCCRGERKNSGGYIWKYI